MISLTDGPEGTRNSQVPARVSDSYQRYAVPGTARLGGWVGRLVWVVVVVGSWGWVTGWVEPGEPGSWGSWLWRVKMGDG